MADSRKEVLIEDPNKRDCAVACSNTGYFILAAMGLTHKEIVDLETD